MTFPTMEWTGFDEVTKQTNLSHIFNADQLTEINERVGKSIFFTHLFTETVKTRSEQTSFSELLQFKVSNPTRLCLESGICKDKKRVWTSSESRVPSSRPRRFAWQWWNRFHSTQRLWRACQVKRNWPIRQFLLRKKWVDCVSIVWSIVRLQHNLEE